jgi:hypothetical protein
MSALHSGIITSRGLARLGFANHEPDFEQLGWILMIYRKTDEKLKVLNLYLMILMSEDPTMSN